MVNTCPPELSQFLLEQFSLPEAALYRVNGPVNLVRLTQLIDQADADPALRFPLRFGRPGRSERLPRAATSIFARLRQHGDVLLHHPFESFEPVVAVPARGGATTPTCWPSSRPSTAPAATAC